MCRNVFGQKNVEAGGVALAQRQRVGVAVRDVIVIVL